jgi:hypothetical protein
MSASESTKKPSKIARVDDMHKTGLRPFDKLPQNFRDLYERNAQSSPLITLPAEIRNSIFAYACFDNVHLVFTKGKILASSDPKKYTRMNTIQLVSRQLRVETYKLEYKLDNPFIIHGRNFMRMRRRGDTRLRGLTNDILIWGDLGLKDNPDEVLLHDNILRIAKENPKVTSSCEFTIFRWTSTMAGLLKVSLAWPESFCGQ